MSRASNGRGAAETNDSVTLMYVPGETGRIRRFTIRKAWIRRTVLLLVGSSVALGLLSVDYVRVRRQVAELGALREETQDQRQQILDYSRQMDEISSRLDQIARLDRKLRVITDLDPADQLPLPGIGGLEGSVLEPHQLTRATRQTRHRRMTEMLSQINEAAAAEASSLETLIAHLENETARLGSTPSIAPARGWITSTFGHRVSPFTGNREFHRGLDIAGRMRTPVVAPADGEVIFAGTKRALGNTITLRHGYGIETIYGHLSELSVRRGERVKRGQKLGLMGNTGRSTGPHLHYQVQINGKPVNPQNYILD